MYFTDEDKTRVYITSAVVGTLLLILSCTYVYNYRENTIVTVLETHWKREIARQQYQTVQENDWNIPIGGRVLYTRKEIRGYRRIVSGSHIERGSTYSCGTIDHPKTCRHPDKVVTDYRSEPVYDTKYYYEIDRWVNIAPLITQGTDKELITWPNTSDYSTNAPNIIGNIIIGARTESYWVDTIGANKKNYTLHLEYSFWMKQGVGSKLHITLGFFNNVLKVE